MATLEKNSGYICLHRSIIDHWIYEDAQKFKWWLRILMECNHTDQKVSIGFELIECRRGQSLNSLKTWAKMWRVDKSTVRRFFKLLENDGMIKTEDVQKTTRLTVCNYDSYNSKRHSTQPQRNPDATSTQPQDNPNNNVNNVNNDKECIDGAYGEKERKDFLRFEEWIKNNAPRVAQMKIPFTIKSYLSLKEKYSTEKIMNKLHAMHNNRGLLKNNIDAYLTILNWLRKDENAEQPHQRNAATGNRKDAGFSKVVSMLHAEIESDQAGRVDTAS